jgi:hypothetical protein
MSLLINLTPELRKKFQQSCHSPYIINFFTENYTSYIKEQRGYIFKVLFTSKVFEGFGGDYSISQNFSDSLFTRTGLVGIIPGYRHKSPPHCVFLDRLETLRYDKVFLGKSILED